MEVGSPPRHQKTSEWKPGQVLPQISYEVQSNAFNVSDVEEQMVGNFMKKNTIYNSRKE